MRYLSIVLLFVFPAFLFHKKNKAHDLPIVEDRAVNVLFQTESQGLAWKDLSFGLPNNIEPTSIYYHNGEHFIGTRQGVLYRSGSPESGAWTREKVKDPLSSLAGDGSNLDILDIFSGASGPYLNIYEKGIYQKVPGKDFWWPVLRNGLPDELPFFDFLETADGRIYVCSEGGLYLTTDMGATWTNLYTKSKVTAIVQKNGALLASTPNGLIRSANEGQTWQALDGSTEMPFDIQSKKEGFMAAHMLNVANHVPLGAPEEEAQDWLIPAGDFSALHNVQQLAQIDKVLFCSHSRGISRSSDGGHTWDLVYELPTTEGYGVRIELLVVGKKLYALMMKGGC